MNLRGVKLYKIQTKVKELKGNYWMEKLTRLILSKEDKRNLKHKLVKMIMKFKKLLEALNSQYLHLSLMSKAY